tara:strand:- start:184 stop:696 length:513 start_codon:yes stop_codon:yes gene_type:complete
MKKAFTIIAVFGTVAVFAQNSETDIDVNMGGMGIDMNVNVRETYTETHTTTTTTTTSGGEDHYVMNGYNGAIGCPWPMDDNQFSDALSSVSSKSFDDDKFTVAKQITGSNCLTAEQVKRMMGELDFEDSKLEYAKFAYDKTFDIGNYYKLNDVFDFSSSIDELNEYINGQ